MTEPTPEAEPTEGQISDPAPSAENPEPDSEPSPNSEAARWRTKLRETEAERDTLAQRVQNYQRRECEAMVSDLLDIPADLFEIGQVDIDAFYNDDGTLNDAELRAAAGALLEERPRLGKPTPTGPRWQNFGQNSAPPPPPKAGWNSVLKQ